MISKKQQHQKELHESVISQHLVLPIHLNFCKCDEWKIISWLLSFAFPLLSSRLHMLIYINWSYCIFSSMNCPFIHFGINGFGINLLKRKPEESL